MGGMSDADGEPARIGYELFRTRGFVVRQDWGRGVEVVSKIGGMEITVKLDEFQTRDLLIGLEAWRAGVGWDLPVAPVERGCSWARLPSDSVAGPHDAGHGDGDGGREGEPVLPADPTH